MCNKIEKAIRYVEMELEFVKNPGTYCDSEYYVRCAAKADILEDVLAYLKKVKEDQE